MFRLIVVNGLLNGGIYAVLAVGFSLIFGVARIINLTHTALYVMAGYFVYSFTTNLGLNILFSLLLSILFTCFIALIIYKVFIERVREHEITVLIITAALAIAIQECLEIAFGSTFRGLPMFVKGHLEVFTVRILYQYIITLGSVIFLLVAVWLFIYKTNLGMAIRGTAQDNEIAGLMGIDVGRISLLVMAISAALAAIAGGLVTPIFVLVPNGWMPLLVRVLAIVVLGGLGSIKGSFAGAFILGFADSVVVITLPMGSFLKDPIYLLVMIGVLLIRPEGLWGVAFEEERL